MEMRQPHKKVNVHQLEERFRSKKELYTFLQQDCQAFLPNLDATNVYFLRQILKGQKEYLKRADVKVAAVPLIEGLTVKDFLEYASGKPSMLRYLPEERDWVHLDKTFICNVLYTLDQEGIQEKINGAMTARKEKLEESKSLTIEMRPEFLEALQSSLNFSTQRGKSIGMLKDSSKRKRRREELDEVRAEEKLLQDDRQSYLLESKRLKAEQEQVEGQKEELELLRAKVKRLEDEGIINKAGQPVMEEL